MGGQGRRGEQPITVNTPEVSCASGGCGVCEGSPSQVQAVGLELAGYLRPHGYSFDTGHHCRVSDREAWGRNYRNSAENSSWAFYLRSSAPGGPVRAPALPRAAGAAVEWGVLSVLPICCAQFLIVPRRHKNEIKSSAQSARFSRSLELSHRFLFLFFSPRIRGEIRTVLDCVGGVLARSCSGADLRQPEIPRRARGPI